MRYIKVKTYNSTWIIEESDDGSRNVVEIIPDDGELRDIHKDILSRMPYVYHVPTQRLLDLPEMFGCRTIKGGEGLNSDIDGWQSSRVVSLEDIEWDATLNSVQAYASAKSTAR